MSFRQSPSVARVGMRRAVRDAFERLRSLTRTALRRDPSPDDSRGVDRSTDRSDERGPGPRLEGDDRYPATLVDPETGPTSRSEVLEYGYTPADYVRAVLGEHGGRIKQRRFADEYGWSSSTISRLLSDLEDRGAIVRYRIGREKAVRLPDERDAGGESDGDDEGGDSDDWSASEIEENGAT